MYKLRNVCQMVLILGVMGLALFAQNTGGTVISDRKINDQDVLAEYDGGVITRKDLDNRLGKYPPQTQGYLKTIDGQLQLLDVLATEEVFYRKAVKMGLKQDSTVVAKMDATKLQFYIREYYKKNVTDRVDVTEAEKQQYYNENKRAFFISPYITIEYIQAENEKAAKEAIKELENGMPFAEASDKFSVNIHAKNLKGVVKNIRNTGHIPGLGNDVALDSLIANAPLDKDAIHGPYKTDLGWHIFRVVERVEGRQRPYLEVEAEVHQRFRPIKEAQIMDKVTEDLKNEYSVTVDSVLINRINLVEPDKNREITGKKAVWAPFAELEMTVGQVLATFSRMSAQEQVFYTKGGGALQLINQELRRALMHLDARNKGYERYFMNDLEYQQTIRYYLVVEAHKRLVQDAIRITSQDAREYYEAHIDAYTTPESRQIQVLWFDNEKTANTAWKRFVRAARRNRDKDMDKIVKKFSIRPEQSILDNQYRNDIVTGVGPDAEFSKRIWETPIGGVSPVFVTSRGDHAFFRVVKENPPVVKTFTETEPRIYGLLKRERQQRMEQEVKEQLFVEYNLVKYPERIRLLLTAEELFNLADNAARQRQFRNAIVYYDQIIQNYRNNEDDYKAAFMKAFLVTEEMNDRKLGLDLFKAFVNHFPKGDLHESAQFMIDILEGKQMPFFESDLLE